MRWQLAVINSSLPMKKVRLTVKQIIYWIHMTWGVVRCKRCVRGCKFEPRTRDVTNETQIFAKPLLNYGIKAPRNDTTSKMQRVPSIPPRKAFNRASGLSCEAKETPRCGMTESKYRKVQTTVINWLTRHSGNYDQRNGFWFSDLLFTCNLPQRIPQENNVYEFNFLGNIPYTARFQLGSMYCTEA